MSVQNKEIIVNRTVAIRLDRTPVVVIVASKYLMLMEEPVLVRLSLNVVI